MQPQSSPEPRPSLLSRITGAFSMITGSQPPAPPQPPPPSPPNLLDVLYDVLSQRLDALRPESAAPPASASAASTPSALPPLSWHTVEETLHSVHAALPEPLQRVDARVLLAVGVVLVALLGTVLLGPTLLVLRVLAFTYVAYASFFALAHSQLAHQEKTRKLGLVLYALLLVYLVKSLL